MVAYRRCRIHGGTYFFTVALHDRSTRLLVEHVVALRGAVASVRRDHPFAIDAMVVLPDHLHAMWSLPEGDADYSTRWRLIKSRFGRNLARSGMNAELRTTGARALWQKRFWEHAIRSDEDHRRHVDYVHFNPVKHGLARTARDWPLSTFHRCVRNGILAPDWAAATGGEANSGQSFGE